MGWDHATTGIVEQQPRQELVGLVTYEGAVRPLGKCLLPARIKQRAIHDRRLLTRQNLILVFDLADIEVVAQQVVQRAAPERDPAARHTRASGFGPDVAFSEVPQQFVDTAKFEVSGGRGDNDD